MIAERLGIELVNLPSSRGAGGGSGGGGGDSDDSEGEQAEAVARQPPADMDIAFGRVVCGRRIGKGGVGSVYAGELQGVGAVALKKVSVLGDDRLENLKQEAFVMAQLRHKHIVFLFGLAIAPEEENINGRVDRHAYLVMELCHGDVGSLIDNSPKLKGDLPLGADAAGASWERLCLGCLAARVLGNMWLSV
jgi:hypothetical protein